MKTGIFPYYASMQKKGVMLYFNGPVCHSVVEGVGAAMRRKMDNDECGHTVGLRVFSVLMEQMQNVVNYSGVRQKSLDIVDIAETADTAGLLGEGQIIVGCQDDEFFIICGNPIPKSSEERIRQKIDAVNAMNKEELKSYYKEQRRKGPDELSCGAGLGFIEMARKASQPLTYTFEPIDDTMSYFSVKVRISEEKKA